MSYADRVQEASATTGTDSFVLAGALTGYRTFASALTTGARVRYAAQLGAEWETGDGVFTAPATLTRENVYASSNANALVSFSAGSKSVWIDLPAQAIADIGLTLAFSNFSVPQ